jgi:hypothetical protein
VGYVKNDWVNGDESKPLDQIRMNHIEEGIFLAAATADSAAAAALNAQAASDLDADTAALVGDAATATGAAVSAASGTLTPQMFGAVGDGVADDTVAIQAAVTAAQGRTLHWPSGTYLTTESITDLHLVEHTGDGAIVAGASTFQPAPVRGQTNTLYVDSTGVDTNDGLSVDRPMREIRAAVAAVAKYCTPLRGAWEVRAGAGTYKGGIDLTLLGRGAQQDDFVRIYGPTIGHPGVPTAVIDFAADGTYDYGVQAFDGVFLMLTDLKFIGAFRYAVDLRRASYVHLNNVHGTGPGKAVAGSMFLGALDHVEYYMNGGIVSEWERGIQEHGQVRRHFENNLSLAEGTQITDCGIGMYAKEGSGGHLDYMQIEDCDTAVMFHTNCNANMLSVSFKRNTVDVLLTNSEIHNEGSIIFGTGADASGRSIVSLGSSSELAYAGWTGTNEETIRTGHRPLILLDSDYSSRNHTGTISETTKYDFVDRLQGGMYAVQGKRFQVTLVGSVVVSPTTPDGVRVLLRVASSLAVEVTIPQGAAVGADFEIVFNVVCTADGDVQKCWATMSGLANPATAAYAARTITLEDPTVDRSVAVSVISGAVADSVTFELCELWG